MSFEWYFILPLSFILFLFLCSHGTCHHHSQLVYASVKILGYRSCLLMQAHAKAQNSWCPYYLKFPLNILKNIVKSLIFFIRCYKIRNISRIQFIRTCYRLTTHERLCWQITSSCCVKVFFLNSIFFPCSPNFIPWSECSLEFLWHSVKMKCVYSRTISNFRYEMVLNSSFFATKQLWVP